MGEVEKTIEVGKLALREDGATLKTVAAALLENAEYVPAAEVEMPSTVEMTDELREALRQLPAVFAWFQMTESRVLTETERARLAQEQVVIEQIVGPLTARREAIKETIRHHMDRVAEAEGRIADDTLVDANGHYILAAPKKPEQVAQPGTDKVWSREFRIGSVTIDGDKLHDLYKAGEIDRKTWLSMTREVRVFDEAKAQAAMEKDPGLLRVFRKIIKRGRPSTQLYTRKNKSKK